MSSNVEVKAIDSQCVPQPVQIDSENNLRGLDQGSTPIAIHQQSNTEKYEEAPNQKESSNEVVPNENSKKCCFFRLIFSAESEKSSLARSVFNLSILSLGTGCLSLPKKVRDMSILGTPFVIIFGGVVNLWAFYMLSAMSKKHGIENYTELALKVCGKKVRYLLDVAMVFYVFGLIIIYQIVLYKLLGGIINELGGFGYNSLDDFLANSFWKEYLWKFVTNYGIAIFILFPICILRDLSRMSFTSVFGVACLICMELIVVGQSPWYMKDYWKNSYVKEDKSTHLNTVQVNSGIKFVKSMATVFYAYSCTNGVLPVIHSLKDNTIKRINKVFNISIILDAVLYLLIGYAGYLSTPLNVPDLIIERKKLWKNDTLMTIGRIAFIFCLMTKIPHNYNSLRISILYLFGIDQDKLTTKMNLAITIPVLAISTLFSVVYQGIKDYVDLVGSFFVVILSFLVPSLIYVMGNDLPRYHWKNICYLILGIALSALGFTSGILTIRDMVLEHKK